MRTKKITKAEQKARASRLGITRLLKGYNSVSGVIKKLDYIWEEEDSFSADTLERYEKWTDQGRNQQDKNLDYLAHIYEVDPEYLKLQTDFQNKISIGIPSVNMELLHAIEKHNNILISFEGYTLDGHPYCIASNNVIQLFLDKDNGYCVFTGVQYSMDREDPYSLDYSDSWVNANVKHELFTDTVYYGKKEYPSNENYIFSQRWESFCLQMENIVKTIETSFLHKPILY